MSKKQFMLLAFLALASATGCDGVTITWDKARNCDLHRGTNFPTSDDDASFDTNIPVGCPVSVPNVAYDVTFVANGLFPSGGSYAVVSGIFQFDAADAYHFVHMTIYSGSWTSLTGYNKVTLTDTYPAAWAGFYPSAPATDYLTSTVYRYVLGYVSATLDAHYQSGPKAVIYGPAEVTGWEGFTLDADLLDPTMIPPVTYSWKKNGNDMGISTDRFYYAGSAPDSNDDFEVTITDLYDNVATATLHVRTKNCVGVNCNDM